MNIKLFVVVTLAVVYFASTGLAQVIPNSELINRLRLNATLFTHYEHGANLREKVRKADKDLIESPTVFGNPAKCETCKYDAISRQRHLQRSMKDADLVVQAKVKRRISTLSPDDTFVFTDVELDLEDIVHGELPQSLAQDAPEITVAVPGGRVKTEGHRLEYRIEDREELKVGQTYLLFLRYIPESHSFLLVGPEGYEISGANASPLLKREDLYGESNRSGSELLKDMKSFAAATKKGEESR